MSRFPLGGITILFFASLTLEERRNADTCIAATPADVDSSSSSGNVEGTAAPVGRGLESPLAADSGPAPSFDSAPNSGSEYKIWRTQHEAELDPKNISDSMFMRDNEGNYVPIDDKIREAVAGSQSRYVVGKNTKLVLLPTHDVLEKGNVRFYGNPEQAFKDAISPYQAVKSGDGIGETYKFQYTALLKATALDPELENYLMYPKTLSAENAKSTTNRGEHIADHTNIVDFGIKQRGPLCIFFQEHGFLAVPESVNNEGDTLKYLRKIYQHQIHDKEVQFEPGDYVALDQQRPPTFENKFDEDAILKRAVASYHFEPQSENPHEPDQKAPAHHMPVPAILPGLSLDTHKYGRGMKFREYGATACLNAVVTRFDENGHVNILANIRPDNAKGDRGEFQMTAGVIQVVKNDFGVEEGSQKNRLTVGQVSDSGQLTGDALNSARAGIHQKTFTGYDWTKCAFNGKDGGPYKWEKFIGDCNDESRKEDADCEKPLACQGSFQAVQETVLNQIRRWNFYKLRAGIVDDQAGTNEAWVETAYVWHHIQGNDVEELELFNIGSPKPGMPQAGAFVWRNIDTREKVEKEKRTSQMAISPAPGSWEPYRYEEIDVEDPYDPYIEYELWHGDHSLGARDFEVAVKTYFEFTGAAPGKKDGSPTWFGKSIPKQDWMNMHDGITVAKL